MQLQMNPLVALQETFNISNSNLKNEILYYREQKKNHILKHELKHACVYSSLLCSILYCKSM